MSTTEPAAEQTTGRDVWMAWVSVLLLPVAFLFSFLGAFLGYFLVGEGLLPLLGQSVEGGDLPLWARAVAMVPAVVVFAVPAVLSSRYARRATEAGDPRGWVPAGILIALTAAFVVVNGILLGG